MRLIAPIPAAAVRASLTAAVVSVPLAVAAETYTVTMAGAAYAPMVVTAGVGDTIRFVNDDTTDHDVFVPTVGFALDLGGQSPGEVRELTLTQAGRFEVECVFHDHMLLTVEVEP